MNKRCYYYDHEKRPQQACPCGWSKGKGSEAICTKKKNEKWLEGIQYECGFDKPEQFKMW